MRAAVALVVRSGSRPIVSGSPPLGVEVEEHVSHAVEAVPISSALPAGITLAVFTSQTAVELGLGGQGGAALRRAIARARIAAVGPATAAALRGLGLTVEVVAAGSAAAILEGLSEDLTGWKILLPVGDDAPRTLPAALERRGASVTRLVVYRKKALPAEDALARGISSRRYAAFFPTSPAAARWLFQGLSPEGRDILRAMPAVALGPSTRAALERRGVARIAVAPEPRFSAALRLLAVLATPVSEK